MIKSAKKAMAEEARAEAQKKERQDDEFFGAEVIEDTAATAPEIGDDVPEVASHRGKNILIVVVLVIVAIGFLYYVFFMMGEKKNTLTPEEDRATGVPVEEATPVTQDTSPPKVDVGVIPAPEAPEIKEVDIPPVPAAPAEIEVEEPQVPVLDMTEEDLTKIEPAPVLPPEPAEEPQPVIEPQELKGPALPPLPDEQKEDVLPMPEGAVPPEASKGISPEQKAAMDARRKAGMVIVDSTKAPGADEKEKKNKKKLEATAADTIYGTLYGDGDLDYVIAQGKIIDAILETAVNTDLPGMLRALVTRDVYAESSKNVLIPKGSRLIGTYDSEIVRRQRRLDIIWNRVLRPDGIDVAIESPATDLLGRAGVEGITDNKYLEMLGNSALVTALGVIGSAGIATLTDVGNVASSTTASTDGDTTASSVGSVTDLQVSEGIEKFQDKMETVATSFLDEKPTITIDQGTRIKVFVNKDIIFPPSTSRRVKVVK